MKIFVYSSAQCPVEPSVAARASSISSSPWAATASSPSEYTGDFCSFYSILKSCWGRAPNGRTVGVQRADRRGLAVQYFRFYGYLSPQQNIMQDCVRQAPTSVRYCRTSRTSRTRLLWMLAEALASCHFFAAQAGARKICAVEASTMTQLAEVSGHWNPAYPGPSAICPL